MSKIPYIITVILGLCFMGQSSWAVTAYITDSMKITLRTGPSTQNKIIAMIPSGQSVEVLESDGDWTHVRILEDGAGNQEGWVLSHYLVTRLPWELKAKSLQKENARFKEKLPIIEEKLGEALNKEHDLTLKLQTRTDIFNKLQKEYESLKQGADGYLNLKKKYDRIEFTLKSTQKDLQKLSEENKKLRYSQKHKWFLTGALVLLCGLIIGLLIGRREKKPRSSFYSLPR